GPGVFVGFAADRRLRENIVVVELEVVAAGVFAGIVFRLQPVIEEVFGVVVLVSFAPVAIIGQQAFGPGVILRVVIFDLVVKADLVRGQPVALFHEVAEEGFFFSFFRDEIGVAGVENTAASVFFVLLVFVIKQGRVIIEESVIVDDRFLALFAGFAGFAVDAAHGIGSGGGLFGGFGGGFIVQPVLAGVENVQTGATAHGAGGDRQQRVGDPERRSTARALRDSGFHQFALSMRGGISRLRWRTGP